MQKCLILLQEKYPFFCLLYPNTGDTVKWYLFLLGDRQTSAANARTQLRSMAHIRYLNGINSSGKYVAQLQ
jgi:hypothetical protein